MRNKEYQKQYVLANKDKIAAQKKAWRVKNWRKSMDSDYRRRYGITWDDYYAMLCEQDSACTICGCVPDERLYVDHCHTSNVVRGLLCSDCNVAIGLLCENTTTIRNAAYYIEQHLK